MYHQFPKFMIKLNLDKLKQYVQKMIISTSLVILTIGSPVAAITQSEAQSQLNALNNQINDINQRLQSNQNQQRTLEGEISAIEGRIQAIQLQINATSAEINILNSRITDLNTQISQAETDIIKQKALLGEYIRQMYIDGQASSVQLILTSNNFSDFVDKSQYLNTMQEKVKDTVGKIEALKKELDVKKNELEVSKSNTEQLKASQVAQRNALDTQAAAKNEIANALITAEDNLVQQKNDSYAQKAALSAAFGETLSGGSTSYPYGDPVPIFVYDENGNKVYIADTEDPWGYYKGECTSYVAWKRLTIGKPIPRAIGNGGEWTGARAGYPQSYVPQYGDAMVFPTGGFGHVAFVEAVRADGWVYISEYNVRRFAYSERWVNPWNYGAYFIH